MSVCREMEKESIGSQLGTASTLLMQTSPNVKTADIFDGAIIANCFPEFYSVIAIFHSPENPDLNHS